MNYRIMALLAFFVLFMAVPVRAGHYTVLAFGDSITQGLHRNASGHLWGVTTAQYGTRLPRVNGDDGYAPVLEQLVSTISGGRDSAYVYNWGYHGERTYTGVNRIDSVLDSRVADFILIMEGANDLYAGLSPDTTQFNIGKMADKALAKDVLPILGGVTPNTNRSDGYIVWQYYYPLIYDAANIRGIPFVDMYNPFAGSKGELWSYFNSGDGLHLNSTGYSYMAELWYAELRKLLHSQKGLPWLLNLLLKND
jgi:lysophospholipase L1-like esterase